MYVTLEDYFDYDYENDYPCDNCAFAGHCCDEYDSQECAILADYLGINDEDFDY